MSLMRAIVRSIAVAAMRDRTWAAGRVFDSDNTPLADAVLGQAAQPYITVYTDMDDMNPVGASAEIYSGENRRLNLVLEIGVASAIRGQNGNIVIQLAPTDQGMEWSVDIVERQALAALFGDPQSPWGDLFKQVVRRLIRYTSRRGASAEKGTRWAARRITLTCATIFDVPPTVLIPTNHVYQKFIALAAGSDLLVSNAQLKMSEVATLVANLLDVTQAPSWEVAQSYLGLSRQAIKNLTPDGTPLPFDYEIQETAPRDTSDTNDFPPGLGDIAVAGDDRLFTAKPDGT